MDSACHVILLDCFIRFDSKERIRERFPHYDPALVHFTCGFINSDLATSGWLHCTSLVCIQHHTHGLRVRPAPTYSLHSHLLIKPLEIAGTSSVCVFFLCVCVCVWGRYALQRGQKRMTRGRPIDRSCLFSLLCWEHCRLWFSSTCSSLLIYE